MIYNDNPKTLRDLEENRKHLRAEAGRETEAGKKIMQIQEERRKKLKREVKKRELEEVKRKTSSVFSRFHAIEKEISFLKADVAIKEKELNRLENDFLSESKTSVNRNTESELSLKKNEWARIDAEIKNLQKQILEEKNKYNQSNYRREAETIEKKRLIEEEKNKIGELESEIRKLQQDLNSIKAEEFRNEQYLRNLELKSSPGKKEIMREEAEVLQKTFAEKELERRIELLAKDLENDKNKTKKKIMINESEIGSKKRLLGESRRKISAQENELQKIRHELDTLKKQEMSLEQELRMVG